MLYLICEVEIDLTKNRKEYDMKRLEKRKQKESKRQEHITIKLLLILAILEIIDKLLELLLKLK